MKRLFTTMMVAMFAFGFCVSMSGCGEDTAKTDGDKAAAGGDAASDSAGADEASDSK